MSRQPITISDTDIAYAEAVLLPKGQSFDKDGRRFIKNLETIDLQAIPGSGKTTILLAKLLILAKHLPFTDGSGILVLSHTNAAIHEIERTIAAHCPKLLTYPSFVGTIQSFVDRFLAIPYYAGRYAKRPQVNDERYAELAQAFSSACLNGFSSEEQRAAKYYLNMWRVAAKYRFAMVDGRFTITDKMNGQVLNIRKPKGRIKPENYVDFSADEKSSIRRWLIAFKRRILLDHGILHFDDAYFFAHCYLLRHPNIKMVLQQRFQYVLVDEMQDMHWHQHNLLEDVFGDSARGSWTYQRIGDKRQAIYSGDINLEEIWSQRTNTLSLTGSYRLSPTVARVVEPFGLPRAPIDGRNIRSSDLPPHVIVFDADSEARVIQRFCELVKTFKDAGKMPQSLKYPIKAIAWRKGDDGRFGLKAYWSGYEAEAVRSKTHHTCLKSYLSFARQEDWQTHGLRGIYRKIMDALLAVLRTEGVANPSGGRAGYISERSLLKSLRETEAHANLHDELRMKLFHWSRHIYLGQTDAVYDDVKAFIPRLLQVFGKRLDRASHFVNDDLPGESSDSANVSPPAKPKDNIYRCPITGIEVHVGTVHSAKGETHTATLYLESYYYNDAGKSYESQRLFNQFDGKDVATTALQRVKQSARMVYVGFSRPTHLLCFAVHKNRFDEATFRKNGWEVVYALDHVSTSGK
jgi:hypothetical protein